MSVLTSTEYRLARQELERHALPTTAANDSRFKRIVDMLAACTGLLCCSWLVLLIAIAIKLDSRGSVFYRQIRLGKDGTPFTIYKFRTMHSNADELAAELRHKSRGGLLFKNLDDPRLTRVGRWLRQTSLDELPQLINILRGEMSLVGPRPLPVEDTRYYEEWQWGRLAVMPGLTGLWQVSGRSRLSSDQMVRLDLYYIENWTPYLDLFIILRTFWVVLTRDGAY